MSLEDHMEDLKKQIAEAEEREGKEIEEEIEEEQPVEESVEETPEETSEKPKIDEVKEEEPEKLDSSAYARMRRETAAAKKLAEDRAIEIERLKSAQQAPIEQQEQQVPQGDPELEELKEERRKAKAFKELARFDEEMRQVAPDFDDVSEQYKNSLYTSFKFQNPNLSHEELFERTSQRLLEIAGKYYVDGLNPSEEMYHDAIKLGIKARVKEEKREVPKPDLDRLVKNKKRSSGFNAASGNGAGGQVTKKEAASYSPQDWMRLTIEERARLLAS